VTVNRVSTLITKYLKIYNLGKYNYCFYVNNNKGQKPVLDHNHVYTILENNKLNLFEDGILKPYTAHVWTTICEQLGNKLNPKTLYISVYQDRHDYQSKLKKSLNIFSTSNGSFENSSEDETHSEQDEDENKKTLFNLAIPYKQYLEFEQITIPYKRKDRFRVFNVLKQNTWTDIINDAFLEKYKLPCNFIYKRSVVSSDTTRSKYFIKFYDVRIKVASCLDQLISNHSQGNRYYLIF